MSKNKKVPSAQRIAIVPAAIMAALAAQPIAAQEQTRSKYKRDNRYLCY